jgi:hypothetical protein
MPFVSLVPHPSTAAPDLEIEAAALLLGADTVAFQYRVSGQVSRLRIPAERTNRRTDELWRHLCFEAFMQPQDRPGYVELNFAPSGAWAAYSFESYRGGMQPLATVAAPTVECRTNGATLTLDAVAKLASAPPRAAVGLSAVIEDLDGNLSYWALAHPRERPDFHDRGAWTSQLERRSSEDRP